eukprot:3487_1
MSNNNGGSNNNNGGLTSKILDEPFDPNFEPSTDQIEDYAKFMGMKLDDPVDKSLLYLAREALIAPLPHPWKPCQVDGQTYYFNFETGESLWEHPVDTYYKKMFEDEKKRIIGETSKTKRQSKKLESEKPKRSSAGSVKQDALGPLKSPVGLKPLTTSASSSRRGSLRKLKPLTLPRALTTPLSRRATT